MANPSEHNHKRNSDSERDRRGEPGFVTKLTTLSMLLASVSILLLIATIPLSEEGQLFFFGSVFVIALLLKNVSGRMITLALVWLSVMVSCRYIYWRLTGSTKFEMTIDTVLCLGLLLAELYTFAILLLGYFQTAWPLDREPAELPEDTESWPTVDIYIPTYNEPLKVVKPTVIGAMNIDWPKEKINVYILDDGRRQEFREFAEKIGAKYITRPNNDHAKAGNINHALTKTSGDLIAVFDCDHVPVSTFLKTTVGWFMRDKKLAVVQTPHHFYSPDPFERNLGTFREVPNEGQLFYGLIQNGNDLWDASFFCGSCAILKREALEAIGGIATGSVTEDAYTALRLHRHGYRSAYINRIQAAGLATESLSVHVGQRVRWARGMAQILRRDCPLWGKGLNWRQRLCYTNAMLHFFYGMPRLVFMTAPLAYLFLEAHIIQASTLTLATYLLPFLFVTSLVNSRLQGNYRHSYWAEVYETAVSWYSIIPTWLALINPKFGKFNVTAKGGLVEDPYFDLKIAFPYLVLLLLNIAGFIVGIVRLLWWNAYEYDTVLVNLAWVVYNMIILGAVVAVAKERIQKRRYIRIARNLQVTMHLPGGRSLDCKTLDLSEGGGAFELSEEPLLEQGATVHVALHSIDGDILLPAQVKSTGKREVRVAYTDLSFEQERALTQLLFSRDEVWSHWMDAYERDRPLRSLAEVLGHGLNILIKLISPFHVARGARLALGGQSRMLAVAIFIGFMMFLMALLTYAPHAVAATTPVASEATSSTISLKEMGAKEGIRITAFQGRSDFRFSLRLDEVVTDAELVVAYAHGGEKVTKSSSLDIFLNGEMVRSIPLTAGVATSTETAIRINPFLLSDYNTLAFAVSIAGESCETAGNNLPSVVVSPRTTLNLKERHLRLPNDLAKLPLPFFDPRDQRPLAVPFAFGGSRDSTILEAAGAVSGWLGAHAAYRGARFTAHSDELPSGNSIVFASADNRPAWLNWPSVTGPTLTLASHPQNPDYKLLLVLGRNADEVKIAAHALVSGGHALSGESATLSNAALLPKRKPYDAPNWLPSDRPISFTGLKDHAFKVPPDLFVWRSEGIPMELSYTPPANRDAALTEVKINFNGVYGRTVQLDSMKLPGSGFFQGDHQETTRIRMNLPAESLGMYNQIKFYPNGKKPAAERNESRCNEDGVVATTGDDATGSAKFTLDFSRLPHHTALPDLAKFANLGYPFSRYADLSETAVVLPAAHTQAAISTYLTLMGYMGSATGAAPTGVRVIAPDQLGANAERDLIILGAVADQPLLQQWRSHLPLHLDAPENMLRQSSKAMEFIGQILGTSLWQDRREAYELMTSDSAHNAAAIMGFESPLAKGRSVVVLTSLSASGYASAAEALNDPAKISRIRNDAVIITDSKISSFSLGDSYSVGELPWLTSSYWYLSDKPYLIFVLVVICITMLAIQSHQSLLRRARMRLNTENV